MTKKPTITSIQISMMMLGSALIFPFTFMPILNTPPANQDVWIVLLISILYIVVINMPLLFLINKFRGVNINEMMEIILGKFFGSIALIFFILFFVFCSIACTLFTLTFMQLYLFLDTPTWALLLFMIVPVSYAAYKGAGTIARLAVFFVPLTIIIIIFFVLFGINKMDFNVLKPMLVDSTFLELNQGAFFTAFRYSEILIFLVFTFFLEKSASINKTYATSLLLFGACFMLILIPTMLVLGVKYAQNVWDPYFTYARQIKIFSFFDRVQSLNLIAWFPGALLKLTVYNFMASYTLSGIVKVKTHKYFVIPISIIVFIVCLFPFINKSSTVDMLRSDQIFPWIVIPVIFLIPLIMVIVYFSRRKKINSILKKKI